MLRKMTLRARLSLLIGGVIIAGLGFGVGLLILHAGTRVSAEAEGATRLARELVQATLPRLSTTQNPRAVLAELMEDAGRLRHVRVIVEGEAPSAPAAEKRAPDWFSALVFRAPAPTRVATPLGTIEIAASSQDEIAEIWEEIVWLAVGAAGVAAIAFALVSYAVSRALAPIGALSDALQRLEQGDHAIRVPAGSREFVMIAERIDSLAATLQRLDSENRQLLRRMIHVQDEERRAIARDLHDEIGPFLFTVRAGVGALARKAQSSGADPARLAEDCAKIDAQIAALQQVNRRILGRLRPAALEEMGLADAIEALARGWRETRAEIAIDLSLDGARAKLDETTAITAYRVVQEGLTNAFRHSGASRIAVAIARAGQRLRVEVRDDGTGLPAAFTPAGLGLRGMSERVSALGGTLRIDNGSNGGARLVAELPLDAASADKTRS
ncbi:ATP-binding protein [Methylocystis iwaonis]|uniref:ATP-binding protein n=1 Tax=Methylocystis iwaonis TaxID=2885079 RepID=UPI002E7B4EBE|nr:ATP-binding protein [Methylocystis iwaonis]